MAILHGSWFAQPSKHDIPSSGIASQEGTLSLNQRGYFFLWGERWRRVDEPPTSKQGNIPLHPFCLDQEEFDGFWRSLPFISDGLASLAQRWRSQFFLAPSRTDVQPNEGAIALPYHSAEGWEGTSDQEDFAPTMQTWHVEGIALTAIEAIQLLQELPLGQQADTPVVLGADMRFWSHVARWHLDLLARSKFLPTLKRLPSGDGVACWQVCLDSATDQERLAHFSETMPGACRAYPLLLENDTTELHTEGEWIATCPTAPDILLNFLNQVTDAHIRWAIATRPLPTAKLPADIPLREWLQALRQESESPHSGASAATASSQAATGTLVSTSVEKLDALNTLLSSWVAPVQHQLTQQLAAFRTCLILQPPVEGDSSWWLAYGLQAIDDPDFQVSAAVIWAHPVDQFVYAQRIIQSPQETFLAGLGLAARLYSALEPSLLEQQPLGCSLTAIQAYEFIKTVAWRLQENGLGVVLPPSLASQQNWANRLGLSIRAESPGKGEKQRLGLQSLLNFKWELSIGGQRLSKAEFERLVALNTPLVEINGEWVELRSPDIKAAQAFFANHKQRKNLSLEDALRMSQGDTQVIDKLPVVHFEASGALEELLATLTHGNQSIELLATPKRFQGELRPYQQRGMSWLAFLERWGLGACLADDMGLGKTIQLIAFLLHLQEQKALTHPTLLVCPTSVLGNWEREVKRFAPDLRIAVHHGEKRLQGKEFATAVSKLDLLITSYTLVYRDAKLLKSATFQGIVLDEAQNIKNPQAKQSQAVRELEAQFRIAMTGTPVENRLSELWSIMEFLNPGFLGPRNFFQRRFSIPIERYGDAASLRTLRSLVRSFILRRLKTDRTIIQDLPEKQEMTVFCGLSVDQATLYQQLVDQSLQEIDAAEGIQRRGLILALLTKLKQLCNHPLLLSGTGDRKRKFASIPDDVAKQSGKLQRLREMLEEVLAEGDRALIFTQFAEWGKVLQTYLTKQYGQDVLFLYGSTPKKQREIMIDRFQNDPQAPHLFILSLKAGGVGLNLTRANHVFHIDRWWNPAVENQATDRVFRIGQQRNVQVHKFVCTGTLEERIHEIIESKRALSEQIVGSGENWLTEFDTEQLRNLLLLDRDVVIQEEDA